MVTLHRQHDLRWIFFFPFRVNIQAKTTCACVFHLQMQIIMTYADFSIKSKEMNYCSGRLLNDFQNMEFELVRIVIKQSLHNHMKIRDENITN